MNYSNQYKKIKIVCYGTKDPPFNYHINWNPLVGIPVRPVAHQLSVGDTDDGRDGRSRTRNIRAMDPGVMRSVTHSI